ncbi:helix-turn-helix transcriptional regulator [Collimonas humicola]|uniref:LexA family transcriptional regulator n=1 Tax=Collimonas humicola TaxID=2825886 RepID=UPI001B8ABE86|nr:LexA family transcriptional regulator [Collimonas humicola]
MPAKPLTDEQLQDAIRLKSLFLRRKKEDPSLTQEKLAFLCGWKTQGTITHYFNGRIPLNLGALQKFAEALDARLDEISPSLAAVVGALQKNTVDHGAGVSTSHGHDVSESNDNVEIRMLYPSELNGTHSNSEGEVEFSIKKMTISKAFLHNNAKFSSLDNLALTPALGDSMEGTYNDGDLLLIDRGVNQIRDSGIYGFKLTDEIFTRRIERRPDGGIAIIPDNKKYDSYTVAREAQDKLKIHYRVVFAWAGKKFT